MRLMPVWLTANYLIRDLNWSPLPLRTNTLRQRNGKVILQVLKCITCDHSILGPIPAVHLLFHLVPTVFPACVSTLVLITKGSIQQEKYQMSIDRLKHNQIYIYLNNLCKLHSAFNPHQYLIKVLWAPENKWDYESFCLDIERQSPQYIQGGGLGGR